MNTEYLNKVIPPLVLSGKYIICSLSDNRPYFWIYDEDANIYFSPNNSIIEERIKMRKDIQKRDIIQFGGDAGKFNKTDLDVIDKALDSMTREEKSKLPLWFIELIILKKLSD